MNEWRRGRERKGDRGSHAGPVLTAPNLMQGLSSQMVRSGSEPKSDFQPTEPPGCPYQQVFMFLYLTVYFLDT